MKKIIDKTLLIYAGLGILNYGFCSLIMLLFRNLFGWHKDVCMIISFCLQTMISFFLNRYVTFRGIKISKYWPLKFVISIAVCFLVAKVLLHDLFLYLVELPFFVGITDWLYNFIQIKLEPKEFRIQLVMLATTFIYCVINYIGQRYFVFRAAPSEDTETAAN